MKITVVTVSFNCALTIENTILSVLNQTYPDIEYIIIDGGSTDGTVDIIKKYADRLAYWVSEPDKGIYDAMNKGIEVASGDFIIFIGADDSFYSYNTIEKAISKMLDANKVYYGQVRFSSNKKIYSGKYNVYKLSVQNICHQSIFYPRLIYKNKKYDLNYNCYADWLYNLSLFKIHNFVFLDEIIAIFCTDGRSKNGDERFAKDQFLLNKIYLGRIPAVYSLIRKWIAGAKNIFIKT